MAQAQKCSSCLSSLCTTYGRLLQRRLQRDRGCSSAHSGLQSCQLHQTRTKRKTACGRARRLKPEESGPKTRLRAPGCVQVRFSAIFVGRLELWQVARNRGPVARPHGLQSQAPARGTSSPPQTPRLQRNRRGGERASDSQEPGLACNTNLRGRPWPAPQRKRPPALTGWAERREAPKPPHLAH